MLKTDTLHITPEVLALIAQIDEFKGAWRALGSLAPERLLALRRVATIEGVTKIGVRFQFHTQRNRCLVV